MTEALVNISAIFESPCFPSVSTVGVFWFPAFTREDEAPKRRAREILSSRTFSMAKKSALTGRFQREQQHFNSCFMNCENLPWPQDCLPCLCLGTYSPNFPQFMNCEYLQ